MTLALRYAVNTDVGLLREGNEDSAYAGPNLLAIADGMGGHAAGEVASSVAISALASLDTELPQDQMISALAAAVADGGVLTLGDEKNGKVLIPADKIAYLEVSGSEPRRIGFGNTL